MNFNIYGLPYHGVLTLVGLDSLHAGLGVRDINQVGCVTRRGLRAELQGLPTFDKLVGPMWDGGAVRYETRELHAQMSI